MRSGIGLIQGDPSSNPDDQVMRSYHMTPKHMTRRRIVEDGSKLDRAPKTLCHCDHATSFQMDTPTLPSELQGLLLSIRASLDHLETQIIPSIRSSSTTQDFDTHTSAGRDEFGFLDRKLDVRLPWALIGGLLIMACLMVQDAELLGDECEDDSQCAHALDKIRELRQRSARCVVSSSREGVSGGSRWVSGCAGSGRCSGRRRWRPSAGSRRARWPSRAPSCSRPPPLRSPTARDRRIPTRP